MVNEITRNVPVVIYILAMIGVIACVDFLFLKDRFWARLMVNIGIVVVFAAFYLFFLKRPTG
jgi:MFS-type transporter involved in bile tolerance (Atg22 family)